MNHCKPVHLVYCGASANGTELTYRDVCNLERKRAWTAKKSPPSRLSCGRIGKAQIFTAIESHESCTGLQ